MATLLKVLNNLADIKSAGGVALRVRTQDVWVDATYNYVKSKCGAAVTGSFRDSAYKPRKRQ
jgi:hypothetical protein